MTNRVIVTELMVARAKEQVKFAQARKEGVAQGTLMLASAKVGQPLDLPEEDYDAAYQGYSAKN